MSTKRLPTEGDQGSLARGWIGGHAPLPSATALQQVRSMHRKGKVKPTFPSRAGARIQPYRLVPVSLE